MSEIIIRLIIVGLILAPIWISIGWIKLFCSLATIIFIVRYLFASPLRDNAWIESIILRYAGNSPWGLLVALLLGIGLTCAVHSSSATTWVMISLVGTGVVPMHTGIAFIMGANIGTTVDAFIASWVFRQHSAIVVAYSHILFNFIGTSIMFPVFLIARRWIY